VHVTVRNCGYTLPDEATLARVRDETAAEAAAVEAACIVVAIAVAALAVDELDM
jgi:hypothetical protein